MGSCVSTIFSMDIRKELPTVAPAGIVFFFSCVGLEVISSDSQQYHMGNRPLTGRSDAELFHNAES